MPATSPAQSPTAPPSPPPLGGPRGPCSSPPVPHVQAPPVLQKPGRRGKVFILNWKHTSSPSAVTPPSSPPIEECRRRHGVLAALVSGDEETSESLGVDTIADFDLAALPEVQDWRAHRAATTVLLAGLTRHSGDLDPDEPTIWRWLKHTDPISLDPERPHKCGHEEPRVMPKIDV